MTAHTYHFARTSEPADIKWSGGDASPIPTLIIAGTEIYLQNLGAGLGPWLLALSDRLAEFADAVAPDGTRRRPTADLTAAIHAECDAEADRQMIAGLGGAP